MKNFGIIVVCCKSDYWSTKACCASIRYFLGDIPICLLIDGTFSVSDLQKAYGVQIINHNNVSNKILRQRSFGYGVTKMIAFWESPFEYFLLLDADTIVWGDILKYANFQQYDLIIDQPKTIYSDTDVNKWFFDTKKIGQHFPDFSWQNRDYVCTGVILAKRGLFPLEQYIEMLDLQLNNPTMFFPGEMGFLNFMMFLGADKGNFRLGQSDIQIIVQDYEQEELKNHFLIEDSQPVLDNNEAKVIHYAGIKALMSNSSYYIEPMTFFRKKFLKDAFGLNNYLRELAIKKEEYLLIHPRFAKLLTFFG